MGTIGIIVAAGGSRRMGQPKALLPLEGSTLLGVHLAGLAGQVDRRRVVLGSAAEAIAATLPLGVERVDNLDWARGHLGDSLALALAGLHDDDRVLFTPIDAPPAPPSLIAALLAASGPAVASFQGQGGHPVAFPVGAVRPHLPAARLDQLLLGATPIEGADASLLLNLNDPAAWADWLAARPPRRAAAP
jgi:molybdenum cofactor cytidylyltransferase